VGAIAIPRDANSFVLAVVLIVANIVEDALTNVKAVAVLWEFVEVNEEIVAITRFDEAVALIDSPCDAFA
jgi:hypothetical protein